MSYLWLDFRIFQFGF